MPHGGAREGAGRPKNGEPRIRVGKKLPKPATTLKYQRPDDSTRVDRTPLPMMPKSTAPDEEILDAFVRLNQIARLCMGMASKEQAKINAKEKAAEAANARAAANNEPPSAVAQIAAESDRMGQWLERAARTLARMIPYQRPSYSPLPAPRPGDWDLSKLDVEELDALERMALKAQGKVIDNATEQDPVDELH